MQFSSTMNSTYYQLPPAYGAAHPDHVPGQQHYALQSQPSPEAFLTQAFPTVDRATISAILASTRGEVDPAYNALLAISGSNPPQASPYQQSQQPPLHHSTSYSQTGAPPSPYYLSPQRQQPPLQQSSSYGAPSPHPAQSPYLAPIAPPANHLSPAASPKLSPRAGSSTPSYSLTSPHLQQVPTAPPRYDDPSHDYPPVLKMGGLSLNSPNPPQARVARHLAQCDGCGADPIRGIRLRCLACSDYDLCGDCKNSGVHNHHRFEEVKLGAETHYNIFCDGCKIEDKSICGTRYECQKHENEDWCERCVNAGIACGGPYNVITQTELGRQLETNGCLPMPQEWIPLLSPVVATYNVELQQPATRWLDSPRGLSWYNKPKRDRKNISVVPAYTVEIKYSDGRFVSNNKKSWTLKAANGAKLYSYLIESERKTRRVKGEQFGPYQGTMSEIGWDREPSSDTISFTDHRNGTKYRWVSNRSISTLNHERFDFQRNALFEHRGGQEKIVADWTWWDGHDDPEDCLSIRDPHIDHAMVIASLGVVHDYQWRIMTIENSQDPDKVIETEERARLTRLGVQSYWYASDYSGVVDSGAGSSGKMSTAQKLKLANQAMNSFNQGADFGNNVATIVSSF